MAGRFSQSRAGLTLTELAVALGAMGLIMAGVWAVVSVVWNNYESQRLNQQVTTIVQNVRDYYMNIGSIQDPATHKSCNNDQDITAILDDDDRRLIPTEMRRDPNVEGSGINHALAVLGASSATGSLRVTCQSLGSNNKGSAFQVRLFGLKREPCIRLLMQFPILTPEMGVTRVVTPGGGSVVLNLLQPDDPGTGFPMTITTANAWCSQSVNEVDLEFKLRN